MNWLPGHILLGHRDLRTDVVREEEGSPLRQCLQPSVRRDRGHPRAPSPPRAAPLGKVCQKDTKSFPVMPAHLRNFSSFLLRASSLTGMILVFGGLYCVLWGKASEEKAARVRKVVADGRTDTGAGESLLYKGGEERIEV